MAKILVVDDAEDITEMIRHFLADDGHDVTVAHSVPDAKEILNAGDYEVLITDILMPGESGLSLIDYASAMSKYDRAPLKIVAISGGGPTMGKDIALGAAAFLASKILQKPFSKEKLTGTIRALLASDQAA